MTIHKRKHQRDYDTTVCGEPGMHEYQWRHVTCKECLKKAPPMPGCRWVHISKKAR